MIRYGIKTWKSVAMPAVLFLAVAVYVWVSAVQLHVSVSKEVAAYGKIMCTLDDSVDNSTAETLFGQYNGSYVYDLQATLQNTNVQKEYSVTGIEAGMIPGTLIEGNYYTDESSTLSMVMNQAASAELTGADGTGDSEQTSLVGHSLIMGSSSVKICGIVEDASDTPALYISIPAAKAYLQQQGTTGEDTEDASTADTTARASMYWIKVSDLKSLLQIQEQMNSRGITTSVDENQVMQWREQRIRQSYDILMGFLALAGYVSCIILSVQRSRYQEEPQRLRVYVARAGMSSVVGAGIGLVAKYLTGLWT